MSQSFRERFTEDGFYKLLASAGTEGSLAQEHPFYPLLSPGMPPIGKSFRRAAEALAGGVIDSRLPPDYASLSERQKKQAWKAAFEPIVYHYATYLYYRALWDDEFSITLDFKGRPKTVNYVLGHQWGYDADGPRRSRIAVIGKCPGRDELASKRNFVGQTSQYFHGKVEQLGFTDHAEWYLTNVCRFPSVDPTSDTLRAEWIADCMPLLQEELRLVRPRFILLLGAEAISAVLGKGCKFKNTNGRTHRIEIPLHGPGEEPDIHVAEAVTCVHPAACCRDPKHEDDLIKALKFFRSVISEGLEISLDPERNNEHIICHSAEHLEQIAARMEEEKRTEFAIDTEFDGDTPKDGKCVMVQFSWEAHKAVVVELSNEKGEDTFVGGREAASRVLTRIFRGPKKRIIGHYFSADLWWLKHLGMDWIQDQFKAPVDDPDPDGLTRLFGWQKTAFEGGFDTILAAHAHEETADLGLKELSLRHTSAPNYEVAIEKWKAAEAKRLKCSTRDLPGYGACPREILRPYAAYDADVSFRLYRLYNDPGGMLDDDRFHNCCRPAFWIAMRALPACYEMHEVGIPIDVSRAEELMALYREARNILHKQLCSLAVWPDFNPDSPIQARELMFGTRYNGKISKVTQENVSVRPEGARTLELLPYKSTGKKPKLWADVRSRGKEEEYTAAVDKETLTVYAPTDPSASAPGKFDGIVGRLRDLRYVGQVLKTLLRPPKEDKGVPVFDENGNKVYERGLLSFLQPGGTIHTNISQTKETRRYSSWAPPLQNWSKKREVDYQRILGAAYKCALRSMATAPLGFVIVSADYTGAELDGMAIQAGDMAMLDHCRRSKLPDTGYNLAGEKCAHGHGCRKCVFPHLDYYDIHANVAITAFRPRDPQTGEPLPKGRLARYALKNAKLGHYRDAAKPVDFGYAYGMKGESAWRKAVEGGANITREEADALIIGLETDYPSLPAYFAAAAQRAHQPMFMANCFSGYRRTYPTSDRKTLADLERQFQNFGIQSLVADAVSGALANFLDYREEHDLHYRLALQLHDDIISFVPIPELETYYDEVVPECMERKVDIWPCDFDGNVKPDPDAPYHLKPGRSVYLRWGEALTEETAKAHGIPLRFVEH